MVRLGQADGAKHGRLRGAGAVCRGHWQDDREPRHPAAVPRHFQERLRTTPIHLDKPIRAIASRTVHNAFHHEARSFAQEIGDAAPLVFLVERIEELSRIMHSNIVE